MMLGAALVASLAIAGCSGPERPLAPPLAPPRVVAREQRGAGGPLPYHDVVAEPALLGEVMRDTNVVSDEDLDFCASETNRYRAQLNLPPVARSAEVETYARAAAQADHASRVAHSYTAGVHGDKGAFAENEVLRWPFEPPVQHVVAEAIAAFWSEGPGGPHYENLRGDRQVVGCGVWIEDGAVTVVQHFR